MKGSEQRDLWVRQRDTVPNADRAAASAEICSRVLAMQQIADAQSVFIDVSTGSEVDTRRLIEQLLAQSRLMRVPFKLRGAEQRLADRRAASGARLKPNVRRTVTSVERHVEGEYRAGRWALLFPFEEAQGKNVKASTRPR